MPPPLNYSAMRKTLFIFFTLVLSGCAVTYRSPSLQSRITEHKTIAIIPFDVLIQYRRLPKGTTVEAMKAQEKNMAYMFQSQLYTRFLKKEKIYTIAFQDIDQTNALLGKNNIGYKDIQFSSKEELGKILNVDAIISGKIVTSKPMSTGGALVTGVLTGYYGATNQVDVTLNIHDASDSKLLWKYDHSYSGSVGSSPESLSNALFNHISKKFPYKE